MTSEKLEKAGQIDSDIKKVRGVIENVKKIDPQNLELRDRRLGGWIPLGMCPREIPQCVLSLVLNSLETKLADLQKQFEEL